jgi:4-hydroxy-3-polyprenylbenzoate decarboxylase
VVPFEDFQSYLQYLEAHDLLKRVGVEVDPDLEITEIATRIVREEGPALLFDRVKGSSYRLAINFMGNPRLIELVLGMHPREFGEKFAALIETLNPPSLGAIWDARWFWPRFLASRPQRVLRGLCQEVEEVPDLDRLPIIKCWPKDGGKFLTFPLVITEDPNTGISNMGIYRMHVYGKDTTGMHMQIQKGVGFHYHEAEKKGEPLELACVLGADPTLMLAGIFPLPEGFEEIAFSGMLRGKRTRLVKALTIDVHVPATAEIVLEGVVPPVERRMEGPFGDHFGHYSDAHPFPVFHIKKVTRRRNAVYPAAVVGKPPQEDRYMGDASQEILIPFIKMMRPEVRDMWAYYEAGFHNLFVVAVESRYSKEPVKTALGLFGEGQLGLSKCIVLVEPTVNVRSFTEVLRAIRRHFDPANDFILISRAPLDTLDFTSFKMHQGSKIVIDATGREDGAAAARVREVDPAILGGGVRKWRLLEDTLLVLQVDGDARATLERAIRSPSLGPVKIVAAVSPDVDIEDDVNLIWGIFTRFDPARDILFTRTTMSGIAPVYEGVMGIDATWKKGYPEPLVMDPEIVDKVDKRWNRYWSQTA